MGMSHILQSTGRSLLLLVFLSSCQALAMLYPDRVQAEDTDKAKDKDELPDRFMVRGGANFIWNADTNMSLSGSRGAGALINYSDILKGETKATVPRVDAYFRFNPNHSIGFTYYRVGRDGLAEADRSFNFGNVTFPIGATVQSELNIAMYQIYYNYSFYHNEKVELATSVGFYFTEVSAMLTSRTTVGTSINAGTTSASELLAPLPQVGFIMRYHITPRLKSEVRANFFYISAGNWEGSLVDLYLGLEYRLFKHFGIGGALNRIDANIQGPVGNSAVFKVDNSWNAGFVYGSLYF